MKRWIAAAVVMSVVMAWSPARAADDVVPFEEGKPCPECEPGMAWCLVTMPPKLRTETKQIQTRPATFYTERVPARYEKVQEQVLVEPEKRELVVTPAKYNTETVREMVQPASKRLEVIPAQYEEVEQELVVVPEHEQEVVEPAKYETVTERVLIEPARAKVVKVECDVEVEGKVVKGAECYTLEQCPARYETITKTVKVADEKVTRRTVPAVTQKVMVRRQVKAAEVREVEVPAEYRTIERKTVIEPAKHEYKVVRPATYKTIEKLTLVEQEKEQRVEVPAKFKTVTTEVLEEPSRLVWKKIRISDCPRFVTALKRYGCMPAFASSLEF